MIGTSDIKPPRKPYLDVPVHKGQGLKTYSANFSAKKHRTKPKFSEVIIELPHEKKSKEIERLLKDNEEIAAKFNELEDLSVKKILRLKERVSQLQTANRDLTDRFQELQKCYEAVYNQYEACKVCTRCEELKENVDRISRENEALKKRNREVSEDLGMLKTVVFRLNSQLERYQEKLRNPGTVDKKKSFGTRFKEENEIVNILTEDHQGHRHTPISWGSVNSHTLGPLLDAYQDTINEKDEIILNYETEFAKFGGKMKEVLEENAQLYRRLHDDENCSAKLRVQLEQVKGELNALKEHNDALVKKCALKQDKVEDILRIYETKVEQLQRDYQVAHDEYVKLRTENVALKEKIRSLSDVQDDFKNERQNYIPISVHTASVNECKKWYEELKSQYENEKVKLVDALNTLKTTKTHLEEKVTKLEKDLKKSENKQLDLEHSLHQLQLSRSACRKQLHKAMCFAKDMVAEQETLLKALNQRQLENRAVKKIGSEMALRMDSLKTQLKDVQKSAWEEFGTVEQKIRDQEELIESMKEEHGKEVERLRHVIDEQEEKLRKFDEGKREAVSHYQLFKEKYK